jgi:hypothetical protein
VVTADVTDKKFALKDELLVEIVCTLPEEAIDEPNIVLEERPLILPIDDVDPPAEEVLGVLEVAVDAEPIDTEALIDMEALLVVDVVLPKGGEVNGWLMVDIESG